MIRKSLVIVGALLLSHGAVSQESTTDKQIQVINRRLKSGSPYKGYIEIKEDQLIHYQKVNSGIRIIKVDDINTIQYFYDRYDPNDAPYSVELKCLEGECAQVNWADGLNMDYASLIFSFRHKEDAEKMVLAFQKLVETAQAP